MEEPCNCPYYALIPDKDGGLAIPKCMRPVDSDCDYPFYCPLDKEAEP